MMRYFKVLSLALAACLAVSAFTASSAMADITIIVEPSVETGSNEGEGNHVFKAGETEVKCTGATFSGTSKTKTSGTLLVHPTYTGCTFLGGSTPVDTEGCDYELGTGGVVKIVCSGTSTIKVTGPGCTLSYGSQTTEGKATYTNINSKKELTVASNTKATFSKSGFLCGAVSGTVGTYTGSAILKAYEDKGTSGHTYTEGAQVSVSVE